MNTTTTLPLSFTNSFWSADLRRGIHLLFRNLDHAATENDEIIAFVRERVAAESALAAALAHPPPTPAFDRDDGASLLMAFRGLHAESVAQARAHHDAAKDISTLVLAPFADWAQGYTDRITHTKSAVLDNWLRNYEQAQADVHKLKQLYLAKTRRADDVEDDAKFAPTSAGASDKYTDSPHLVPVDAVQAPSVSERISQRLRDIQKKGSGPDNATDDPPPPPHVDKGKGKAVTDQIDSPVPMSPLPPPKILPSPESIFLAGIPFAPAVVSQMLTRAASELPLRPVRFPLLGEYQDAFAGEEFVTWLQESVKEFAGDIDLAENAAQDLTEQQGLLRRLGEFGNLFEGSDDAFYQFRQKAFDLDGQKNTRQRSSSSIKSLQPDNILKRTNTIVNMVTKALNSNSNGEPPHVRARHDADEADRAYRIAVRKLDRHRLAVEERLEDTLKTLQRWEVERLRAVKTVLLQYQGILANIPKSLEQSNERSGTLIAAYQPESDLTALIERYRTGPFRPVAQIYESISHDELDVVFGIDLRKWAEGGWHELSTGEDKKELIPPVVTALLNGLSEAYQKLPNDSEKRKSWIYEVPLPPVHQLREVLNAVPPGQSFSLDLFKGFDAPIIASTIKLWLLELDPPLAMYEGWEEFRKVYPVVGLKIEGEVTEEQRIQNVCAALQRLPRVHLYVLNAFIKHLNELVDSTAVPDETDQVYITKLALSLGRAIVRPKQESELSIQDRHPTLLFVDLMTNYDEILPPTIAKKKHESERKAPTRKRTAPVDMRLSRSRISLGADTKLLLAAQQAAQNPSLARPKSPPVPSHTQNVANQRIPTETKTESRQFVAPPPPPPLPTNNTGTGLNKESPARPAFKEPPPELDDLPPRPTFKEPPPEKEYAPPPMPNFVDPPAEDSGIPAAPQTKPALPVTNVIPPSPLMRTDVTKSSNTGRTTPSNASVTSRSPSPGSEDVVLGSGKTTIARSGSSQSNSGIIRGPRLARGAARKGGAVSNAIASLNRNSVSGPGSGTTSGSPSPTSNRFSAGSPTRRPSSVLGRSALSRRKTSDAEDDIFEKK
ncbi:hypothetical protein APHAL10511_004449 [Amanita phalloides]|nr:hypothetical protein APHAL10511_004449 [Amanita phalloides]